jgi:hypothetical protein
MELPAMSISEHLAMLTDLRVGESTCSPMVSAACEARHRLAAIYRARVAPLVAGCVHVGPVRRDRSVGGVER